MTIPDLVKKGYGLLVKAGDGLQPLLLLLVRLCWGWQFFLTGKGKLANHANVVGFFTELGIPFPDLNAWFVSGVECIGGLLLLIGLASRPVALVLTVNMTVAFLSVPSDRAKVFNIFNDVDPFLEADPFLFLFASVIILAFGAGPVSVDYLIKKKFFKDD